MEKLNNVEEVAIVDEEMICDNSCDGENDKAKLVVGIGVAVAGVAAVTYACKGKIEKAIVKKLEKKGYTIYEPIVDDDSAEGEKISKLKK